MVKKIQYFFVLAAAFALAAGFSFGKDKSNGIKVIVIDPGHGGKDPGCNGVSHKEKDVSLAVALKLGKLIEEHLKDVKVIYTRTTDIFVELEDRAQVANKAKADLFISIHCNAAGKPVIIKDPKTGKKRIKTYKNKKGKLVPVEKPNPLPFGTETYVMGIKNEEGKMKVAQRENSAMLLEDDYKEKYQGFDPESEESYIIMSNYTSSYVIQSANLAMKLQEEYTKKAGRIDKGVHRQSIWVLWRTSMPSILTEIGYLTNPLEEQFLASEKGQEYLAKSIFRGLRKYKDEVEGNKKVYDDDIENQEALENENIKAGNMPGQKAPDELEETDEKKADEKTTPSTTLSTSASTTLNTNASATLSTGASTITESVIPTPTAEVKTSVLGTPGTSASTTLSTGVSIKSATADTQQEKGNNGKDAEADVKNKGGINEKEKNDSVLTAKQIAEKFAKEKNDSANKKDEKTNDKVKDIAKSAKSDIVFKVQFASSDIELNLKQEKFNGIVDGSFYKVKNILKYTSGNYALMKDAVTHQNLLREKGFKDCFIIAIKNGERMMDMNQAKKEAGQ